MQGQVKIAPRFFAREKAEYRDWRFALAREFFQNSVDAGGCDTVEVHLEREGEDTRLTVFNNGQAMTEEVLLGKLLALGETGKGFRDGAIGGMGKAKVLLYFCHKSYSIHTGDLLVQGEGGSYELERNGYLPGTRSSVLLEGDELERLGSAFRRLAGMAQWSGTVTLNGEVLPANLRKGTPRREFSWGKIYTNRSFERLLIVRMQGTPMFHRRVDFKGCVIVELTGKSDERLSANRDSLLWQIGEELDELVLQLSVDKRSALRERKAEIRRFEGERLRNLARQPRAVATLSQALDVGEGPGLVAAAALMGAGRAGSGLATEVVAREEVAVSIGPEFLLQNTTGMVTPEYLVPGPQFSDYSRKLALAWARCLLELHKILDLSAEFSIGFCLDEDAGALSSHSPEYGQVYYISPARLVSQRDKPQCRSFKAAFTGAWADRFTIISLAVHELIHGAFGLSRHDEEFTSKEVEVWGRVLPHLPRLTPLFRA